MPWSASELDEVIKTLAVVCEVTGTNFSAGARGFIMRELEKYDSKPVLEALERCAKGVKSRLTMGAIVGEIERVDRKAISDARAIRQGYETHLRGLCLVECIAWDGDDLEGMRKQLIAKGYTKLPEPPDKPTRILPHWTEGKDE